MERHWDARATSLGRRIQTGCPVPRPSWVPRAVPACVTHSHCPRNSLCRRQPLGLCSKLRVRKGCPRGKCLATCFRARRGLGSLAGFLPRRPDVPRFSHLLPTARSRTEPPCVLDTDAVAHRTQPWVKSPGAGESWGSCLRCRGQALACVPVSDLIVPRLHTPLSTRAPTHRSPCPRVASDGRTPGPRLLISASRGWTGGLRGPSIPAARAQGPPRKAGFLRVGRAVTEGSADHSSDAVVLREPRGGGFPPSSRVPCHSGGQEGA